MAGSVTNLSPTQLKNIETLTKRGFSQHQIADALNIHRSTVGYQIRANRWKKGKMVVDL